MGLGPAVQEAYAKQQERIILETSRVYWRGVTEEPLTLEGVKKVTMESFINIFEVSGSGCQVDTAVTDTANSQGFHAHLRRTQKCTWDARKREWGGTELRCNSGMQHFLGRYRTMLDNGGKDPTTQAGKELRDTVLDRVSLPAMGLTTTFHG